MKRWLILGIMLVLLAMPTYAECIGNTSLNTTLQIDVDGSSKNITIIEPCEFGCDNTTNTCNPSTAMQNVYIIIAFIILIVGGIWLTRRLH